MTTTQVHEQPSGTGSLIRAIEENIWMVLNEDIFYHQKLASYYPESLREHYQSSIDKFKQRLANLQTEKGYPAFTMVPPSLPTDPAEQFTQLIYSINANHLLLVDYYNALSKLTLTSDLPPLSQPTIDLIEPKTQ